MFTCCFCARPRLQGFTIARFAVVLNNAGYAQSAETAFRRYRDTAFFIHDFFYYPLDDPTSLARTGIYRVRCMHSYARRRSCHLFDSSKGEGIALSQYDVGEVQLGFTAVCISLIEKELGVGAFSPADKEALVHMWRLVGYHLGIRDEYNICNSVSDCKCEPALGARELCGSVLTCVVRITLHSGGLL